MESGAELYEIRIRREIGLHWADWFDGMEIRSEPSGKMVLNGPIRDQAALRGLLDRIADLNLDILAVNRIEGSNEKEEKGDQKMGGTKQPCRLKVLMVGYNGANNTGAEALLQADIEDVRTVLGGDAMITVPTLNERNLRRYLSESGDLRIVRIPTLYFGAVRRLVKESDLVMLVEGSTYMDTWGNPLLWAFLWATHCAAKMGRQTLAYAVDAGALSEANERRVRNVAGRTGLIITRNRAAAERLRAIGVRAPMEWTADNAFVYEPVPGDEDWVGREWPASRSGTIGIAAVDYTAWPAVLRPWGPKASCYKWPYYFSRSRERREASSQLAAGYARTADRIIARTGRAVALICMEQLDECLAAAIRKHMSRPEGARIFSARDYDASRMTALLRGLSLLVTSRFHAAVLSLAAAVPQVAVGHDLRLQTFYRDLGLLDDWFLDPRKPGSVVLHSTLFDEIELRVDRLLANPGQQARVLERGYRVMLGRARRNRELLEGFLGSRFGLTSVGTAGKGQAEEPSRLAGAAAGGSR